MSAEHKARRKPDAYYRRILYRFHLAKKIFYLNRIQIFSSGNYDILFPVDKIYKTVVVFHCHISCIQPSVTQNLSCCLFILIIAGHHTGTVYAKLSDFAFFYRFSFFVYYFYFPTIARFSDCSNFVQVI